MSIENRIVDFNYLYQSNVSITGSSENVNFPSNNLSNFFRGRVWRSNGYFVIDSTNNAIDFIRVLFGTELTAIIPDGAYNTTTLSAAIKAAFELVAVDTYTVNYSASNGRWTISSDATVLELLWLSGSNTVTSIGPSIGYAVTDQTGALSYASASTALHTEEHIIIDLKTAENIDSFGIFFDPRIGIKFSDQATFRLQANATLNFDSPAVDVALSLDNTFKVISHFFTSDQHYRYWKVKVADPKNNNLSIELGSIILGKATILTRGVANGFTQELRDLSKTVKTEYGNVYTDDFPIIKRFNLNLNVMDNADVLALQAIYERVKTSTPFLFALDVQEQIFDKDQFLFLGRFSKSYKQTHIKSGLFRTGLSIEEFF